MTDPGMMPALDREVPGIGRVLRTPDDCFEGIVDYPWEPHYVQLSSGLHMAYIDVGPADATETILLLHGEPMWGYLYRTMVPTLVAAGHRVIVPDLIGFGRSDKPVDQLAYTYSNHVAWVTELVTSLDLHDATFFGQDWGGLIGARMVADLETRFSRVVFSNTGLPCSGPGLPNLAAQAPFTPDMLQSLLGMDWRATVDDDDRIVPAKVEALVEAGPAFYFLAWRVYSQEVIELVPSKIVPGWCLEPVSDAALAAYDAPFPTQEHAAGARRFPMLVPITIDDPERLKGDAAWAVYERWNKPALTLWGDHCPHTYMEMGNQFRQRIPGASLPGVEHKVYRASHFIQEDLGPEIAEEIVRFIADVPAS
jgi:haloalkane dehalogenase